MRRPPLGQLRHRRGRLAALGLASLVAAASFTTVAASASTTSVHGKQALTQHTRGTRSGSTSPAKQKVRCESGVGLGRRTYKCKTPMRLVCHKSPGQTVLSKIPNSAYLGTWRVQFSPPHNWGPNGPPVAGGRLSFRAPHGVRREEAIVTLGSAPPGMDVVIWSRCS